MLSQSIGSNTANMPKPIKELSNQEEENQEQVIYGVKLSKIREAYFAKKLEPLVRTMLGENPIDDGETQNLELYLESLKDEGDTMVARVLNTFGGKIVEKELPLPSVDELMQGIVWTETEEHNAMAAINYIEAELGNMRHNVNLKKVPADYWLSTSAKFLSFEILLGRYYIYKSQLFNAKIAEIIDSRKCSRAEAENRAKITKEYADYKMLQRIIGEQNLTGVIERFENLSKKYDAKN